MRILFAEDNPDTVDDVVRELTSLDHEVRVLYGTEGEEVVRRVVSEFRPTGAILDFQMHINGDHYYRWLKAINPAMPIVFYSHYDKESEPRASMLKSGAIAKHIFKKTVAGLDVARMLEALQRQLGEPT